MDNKDLEMTDELKIKMAIDKIVEEAVRSRIGETRHPSKREPVTEFRDPEGGVWISVTVPKKIALRRIITSIIATITVIVTMVGFINKWFMEPSMKKISDESAVAQTKSLEEKVNKEISLITKEEDAKWKSHDKEQADNDELLKEMRQDIKLLLRKAG